MLELLLLSLQTARGKGSSIFGEIDLIISVWAFSDFSTLRLLHILNKNYYSRIIIPKEMLKFLNDFKKNSNTII